MESPVVLLNGDKGQTSAPHSIVIPLLTFLVFLLLYIEDIASIIVFHKSISDTVAITNRADYHILLLYFVFSILLAVVVDLHLNLKFSLTTTTKVLVFLAFASSLGALSEPGLIEKRKRADCDIFYSDFFILWDGQSYNRGNSIYTEDIVFKNNFDQQTTMDKIAFIQLVVFPDGSILFKNDCDESFWCEQVQEGIKSITTGYDAIIFNEMRTEFEGLVTSSVLPLDYSIPYNTNQYGLSLEGLGRTDNVLYSAVYLPICAASPEDCAKLVDLLEEAEIKRQEILNRAREYAKPSNHFLEWQNLRGTSEPCLACAEPGCMHCQIYSFDGERASFTNKLYKLTTILIVTLPIRVAIVFFILKMGTLSPASKAAKYFLLFFVLYFEDVIGLVLFNADMASSTTELTQLMILLVAMGVIIVIGAALEMFFGVTKGVQVRGQKVVFVMVVTAALSVFVMFQAAQIISGRLRNDCTLLSATTASATITNDGSSSSESSSFENHAQLTDLIINHYLETIFALGGLSLTVFPDMTYKFTTNCDNLSAPHLAPFCRIAATYNFDESKYSSEYKKARDAYDLFVQYNSAADLGLNYTVFEKRQDTGLSQLNPVQVFTVLQKMYDEDTNLFYTVTATIQTAMQIRELMLQQLTTQVMDPIRPKSEYDDSFIIFADVDSNFTFIDETGQTQSGSWFSDRNFRRCTSDFGSNLCIGYSYFGPDATANDGYHYLTAIEIITTPFRVMLVYLISNHLLRMKRHAEKLDSHV